MGFPLPEDTIFILNQGPVDKTLFLDSNVKNSQVKIYVSW